MFKYFTYLLLKNLGRGRDVTTQPCAAEGVIRKHIIKYGVVEHSTLVLVTQLPVVNLKSNVGSLKWSTCEEVETSSIEFRKFKQTKLYQSSR